MMEIKYKFSFGRAEEIIKENIKKVDSLDEIKYEKQSGLIVIPKIIGVYQEDKYFKNNPTVEQVEKRALFMKTGEEECIPFSLISLVYDPTIIREDILRNSIKGDSLKRIKYLDYTEELPNFNEKNVPEMNIAKKVLINPSKNNITLLKRAVEHYKLAREEYGLTRLEAMFLEASKDITRMLERKNHIIKDPLAIKLESSFLKFFEKIGFNDVF